MNLLVTIFYTQNEQRLADECKLKEEATAKAAEVCVHMCVRACVCVRVCVCVPTLYKCLIFLWCKDRRRPVLASSVVCDGCEFSQVNRSCLATPDSRQDEFCSLEHVLRTPVSMCRD